MRFSLLAIVGLIALSGCKQPSETVSNIPDEGETAAITTGTRTADDITNALVSKGLPIENLKIVTEESDSNKLMGRPGQYISKTYFGDSRRKGEGMSPEKQNSIEVFANEDDATKRREYIEGVTKGVPMLTQYMVQKRNVLLRLDKALTPKEAKEYENALSEVTG